MKKTFLLVSMVTLFSFPLVGQAASNNSVEDNQVAIQSSIRLRMVYRYRFDTIPPKKFNGLTRIYYEFDSRNNVYIGYYN